MKNMKNLLLLILFAFCGSIVAQNIPGTIDSTFNGTGRVILDNGFLDLYQDVKIQPDGKIVAVGTTYDASYAADFQVTRLLSDGTYDPSFGTNGVFRYHLGYETGSYSCLIKDDGNILVSGISMDDFGGFAMVLLQLGETGKIDSAFGVNGIAYYDYGMGEDIAYAMALQNDGKILLAGHISNENFQKEPAVVRFTENGILDASFGLNGVATVPVTETDNEFAGICVQPDGKIVAAGHISNGLSWFSLLLARFDENGILDPTFDTNGYVNMNLGNVDDEFFDVRITTNGEIIATGFTTTQDDFNYHLLVMKFDGNGALVPGFGEEGMVIWGETSYNVGYAMEILPDDKIVVAGSSGEKAPMDSDWGIWKFNVDGTLDESFGNGGVVTTDATMEFDEALGIAVQEDGKLVAAGKFRMDNNINFGVVRYLNELTVSVPEISKIQEVAVIPNPVRRNGNINIAIELSEAQTISLEIINMAGSVIIERSLGNQAAGIFVENFFLPSGISSGLYFIRLKGNGSAYATKKMIVIE
jgi:uncharacterized delta-60 repeat protein